jgi:glycogen phosphorylase
MIFAGKAHPRDHPGKEFVKSVTTFIRETGLEGTIVFLEDYDMSVARHMIHGCDLWLNTPRRPLEASGTSGMKAALNAVPSLSVLDGWWVEGCIDGVTGWAIGEDGVNRETHPDTTATDAASLYWQLEQVVLPTFYQRRARFIDIMRSSVALNGSFFNTQRMLQQYAANAYAVHGLLRSTM